MVSSCESDWAHWRAAGKHWSAGAPHMRSTSTQKACRKVELFRLTKVADHVVGEDHATSLEHGRLEGLVGAPGDGRLTVEADVAFTLFPAFAVERQLDESEEQSRRKGPLVGQDGLQRTSVDEVAVGGLEGAVDVGGDVGDEEDRLDHVALFELVAGRLEHDVQRATDQTGEPTRPDLLLQTVERHQHRRFAENQTARIGVVDNFSYQGGTATTAVEEERHPVIALSRVADLFGNFVKRLQRHPDQTQSFVADRVPLERGPVGGEPFHRVWHFEEQRPVGVDVDENDVVPQHGVGMLEAVVRGDELTGPYFVCRYGAAVQVYFAYMGRG
ncbi:hypothetical protein T4D_9319 [Trichinella pseudospiralis]|uniref:Uncharacterized protein n=1 Tax=Trichinella pseudospiralis TaxID=6337 RepID=A0A0V1F7Y3_TRIPS|nr:hypothetical protein T4D_9319 [Trichinella pseudospiralis]